MRPYLPEYLLPWSIFLFVSSGIVALNIQYILCVMEKWPQVISPPPQLPANFVQQLYGDDSDIGTQALTYLRRVCTYRIAPIFRGTIFS